MYSALEFEGEIVTQLEEIKAKQDQVTNSRLAEGKPVYGANVDIEGEPKIDYLGIVQKDGLYEVYSDKYLREIKSIKKLCGSATNITVHGEGVLNGSSGPSHCCVCYASTTFLKIREDDTTTYSVDVGGYKMVTIGASLEILD